MDGEPEQRVLGYADDIVLKGWEDLSAFRSFNEGQEMRDYREQTKLIETFSESDRPSVKGLLWVSEQVATFLHNRSKPDDKLLSHFHDFGRWLKSIQNNVGRQWSQVKIHSRLIYERAVKVLLMVSRSADPRKICELLRRRVTMATLEEFLASSRSRVIDNQSQVQVTLSGNAPDPKVMNALKWLRQTTNEAAHDTGFSESGKAVANDLSNATQVKLLQCSVYLVSHVTSTIVQHLNMRTEKVARRLPVPAELATATDLDQQESKANACSTTEDEWRQLVADFRNDRKLAKFADELRTATVLEFYSMDLADDAQAALITKLLRHSSNLLEKLYLYDNSIVDTGATALAGALANSSNLQVLSLESNSVGDAGAKALGEALAKNSSNLKELWLLDNEISDSGASALAKSLQHSSTLLELNLFNNKIGPTGATALAGALSNSSTLLVLNLGANSVGDAGAKALGEALAKNSSNLLELDLRRNSIGPTGATALAGALANSSTLLEKLWLSENNIGPTGATALAGALENSSTLLELDLWGNNIGPTGATALAGALENSSTLLELHLGSMFGGGNNIGDTGATALAGALENSSTLLEKLDVSYNSIGDVGKEALQKAVQGKKCEVNI